MLRHNNKTKYILNELTLITVENLLLDIVAKYCSTWLGNKEAAAAGNKKTKKNKSIKQTIHTSRYCIATTLLWQRSINEPQVTSRKLEDWLLFGLLLGLTFHSSFIITIFRLLFVSAMIPIVGLGAGFIVHSWYEWDKTIHRYYKRHLGW